MGYRSYAEFTMKPNMASSPAVVMSFLHGIGKMVRPRADEVWCSFLTSWDVELFLLIVAVKYVAVFVI